MSVVTIPITSQNRDNLHSVALRGLPIKERFEAQYTPEPNTGCWLWIGCIPIQEKGYGSIWINGKAKRAHRVSYELYNGHIPDGIFVCHKCDVTCCVNPDHLFLGTHSENMIDSVSKGRHAAQNYKVIESKRGTKLSMSTADEIRSRYSLGGITMKRLGAEFGISAGVVCNVVNNKQWVKR